MLTDTPDWPGPPHWGTSITKVLLLGGGEFQAILDGYTIQEADLILMLGLKGKPPINYELASVPASVCELGIDGEPIQLSPEDNSTLDEVRERERLAAEDPGFDAYTDADENEDTDEDEPWEWDGAYADAAPEFPAMPTKPMTLFRIAVVNSTEEIGIEAHDYHTTDDGFIAFTTELATTPPSQYEMSRITAHSVQHCPDGTPVIHTGPSQGEFGIPEAERRGRHTDPDG